ncbi:MAG TPA: undecaprenyl-phosphate glucose phosphotransferase [Candidatus Omnitrophota bacterium]|nr:undecaprenyl-phosphate glucose phosphotransferase [Candidatus Omnitrophota bacterium]HRY85308.1 undecaprenyl-phosphate glucose phosphotransferase [Candidatus Omnitrophota bacterium]
MRSTHSRHLVKAAILVDSAMIVLSFVIAYFFRFMFGLPTNLGIPPISDYWHALWGIIPVYLWLFHEAGLYQPSRHMRRIEEIFLVIKVVTYAIVLLMAATFFYREFSYSRLYLVFMWLFSCIFISVGRYALIQWGYWRRLRKKDMTEVLLIGLNRNTRDLIQWMKNNPHYGQKPVGILVKSVEDIGKHVEDVPILGLHEHWETFIEKLQPDQVVLLDEQFSREKITDLVAACEDAFIDFKMGADIYGLIASNVGVEYVSHIPLLGFRSLPLDDPWNRFLKRIFDFCVAGIMTLAFLPIGMVIAILIKLGDGGPVFYFQERMGRDGKVFRLIKFRTMRINAEQETGPVWAKPEDERRTPTGEILRRWNLDEFPQLLNVLAGNMSLVGPRPERPHFVDKFREHVPRYMARHKVKSGVTGWAQVHGLRGDTSIEERIKYDLYYMEHWSLLLDIEILVMTLFAFKNAY